jgi:3-oxoadipate CoA-transferase beta subunit
VYTSLAVVDIRGGYFVLREKLPDISLDVLQSLTGATLQVNGEVGEMIVPELES